MASRQGGVGVGVPHHGAFTYINTDPRHIFYFFRDSVPINSPPHRSPYLTVTTVVRQIDWKLCYTDQQTAYSPLANSNGQSLHGKCITFMVVCT